MGLRLPVRQRARRGNTQLLFWHRRALGPGSIRLQPRENDLILKNGHLHQNDDSGGQKFSVGNRVDEKGKAENIQCF